MCSGCVKDIFSYFEVCIGSDFRMRQGCFKDVSAIFKDVSVTIYGYALRVVFDIFACSYNCLALLGQVVGRTKWA